MHRTRDTAGSKMTEPAAMIQNAVQLKREGGGRRDVFRLKQSPTGMGTVIPTRPRAFTLIEMLVVMGIIGILVALLFPAIKGAKLAAERADASQMVVSLEAAMKAFFAEYGRYPLQNTSTAQYEYKTNDTSRGYVALIKTLRGLQVTSSLNDNPKGITFLDVPEKKLIDSGSLAGALIDPWDNTFRVFADWDNDNIIQTGTTYGELSGRQVAIWSPGPDGIDGNSSSQVTNREDNLTSWGG